MGMHFTYENTFSVPTYTMYLSSLASTTLAHPLEVLRINVQANALDYISLRRVIRLMFKQKGLSGFFYGYRGAVGRVTVQTLSQYWIFHQLINHHFISMFQPLDTYTMWAISGICGGLISTPIAKLALIRQTDLSRQTYKRRNYNSILGSFMCMYRKGGVQFLFAGYKLHAFHTCALTVLYSPIREVIQDRLVELRHVKRRTWEINLFSIMLTESILSLILTPVDAIRTMIMNADHEEFVSTRHLCRQLLSVHGYRGFFLGIVPALVGIIPHSIVVVITLLYCEM